jgi:two-component system response regulator (stage 0 sporulation protein F)
MIEKLMNIKDAAEYLRMNKMTIYKLAREGKMPAFRVASEWRFRKDLIDRWLIGQLKGKPVEGQLGIEEPQAPKTILIVDDEDIIRDFFSGTLTEYGLLTAKSGEEALEIIKANRPDLVLLDLKMPGIGGIETLRRIKKIDKAIAVIIMTGYGTPAIKKQAMSLGAHSLMAKPFELQEIRSVIKDSLVSKPQAQK